MERYIKVYLATFFLGIAAIQAAARQQQDTVKEIKAIRQLIADYENAWNKHDPQGLAACYDSNATWVNWFGAYYIGRKDIQDHYAAVHSSYFKSSQYYTRSIEDIIFVRPDVAISHVRTGLTGDTRYPGQTFEFRRTIMLTKQDGMWHILAGQNAKLNEGVR